MKLEESKIVEMAGMLLEASSILLKFRKKGFEIHTKSDGTRVCDADIAVNRYIQEFIDTHYDDVNIISEEGETTPNPDLLNRNKLCFCIDPLDGTEAYIKGKDEYTISIGAIAKNNALYGWIAVPAEMAVYYSDQHSIYRLDANDITNLITTEFDERYIMPKDSANQIATSLHDNFIFQSSSLKFVTFAQGLGNTFVQTHHTKIWDVAGGFAILDTMGCTPFSSETHEKVELNSITIPPFFVNAEEEEF